MPSQIDIYSFDEWIGVYLNGDLVFQNHSIRVDEMLIILGIPHTYTYIDDDEFIERLGGCMQYRSQMDDAWKSWKEDHGGD